MIKTPISSQDLRRSLYVKAKAEPTWRFWGLYVHVCKMETLQEAYQMAKSNGGAPGSDGVTFRAIEESGVESFLKQIQDELVHDTYQPMPVRKKEIPKDGGTKVRVLSIPAIRDRVVQGALKLILEPIFEADFQSGSYGYRPKRTAQEAVLQVDKAIMEGKTRVIDLDLRAYFDSVQHYLILDVTGHIGFPRLVDGSSQRDWSNWPAFRIHRYVRERDRILTRVDTGGIPDQGGKAIWSARQKGRAVFAFYSPGPPLGSFTKEMQAFRFFCVGKQTALPRLGNCGRAW